MPFKSLVLTPELKDYVFEYGARLDEAQRWLIERTDELGPEIARNQVSPDQGEFLTTLVDIMGARLAVEVGTFTGFSALCIARGLPTDGRLLCFEVNETWTSIAQEAWKMAGVSDLIEFRLGPAAETLSQLPNEGQIDFAFVDADKAGYWTYHNLLVPRLRLGGLIVYDNVLFRGEVVRPEASRSATVIHEFNVKLAADRRFRLAMLPFADGMTLAQKISR